MIATSLQQSRHLLELGLDPATADMRYVYFDETDYGLEIANEFDDTINKFFNAVTISAWSLSALLEVMPISITEEGIKCNLDISPRGIFSTHSGTSDWKIGYYGKDYSSPTHGATLASYIKHNIIDAAYEMACWLLEQGLIKKGGEQ